MNAIENRYLATMIERKKLELELDDMVNNYLDGNYCFNEIVECKAKICGLQEREDGQFAEWVKTWSKS